ncbi:excinuclease ABC subunit A [Marinibactrum halimedae]|uniref:Excinuclease ATPase subunit n=1 Tax=Marinibactrum halimedae TaxID=1444977 RepID=A0AA37TB99_9GAMM|nr:excinuclease ABC subunit A [Marinibactrum halimedae]MCD9459970.1 excinuclease ABC subunit A [Marinibactrum halimedae]GLS28262.1 hypothetical protein GCM10007877_39810 [Marinibactrum halimedae]
MRVTLSIIFCAFFISNHALARDTIGNYSVEEALSVEKIKNKLGNNIQFYFGSEPHGKVVKNFGEYRSRKKTNAFGKTDKSACQWVFLSTLLSLKNRAIQEGGNAVINIKSIYRGNLVSSNEHFQCGAGAVMAGVSLIGDVVKIED